MQNIDTRYITPIILLISLMFSNTASAGLFGIDGFFSKQDTRCRLEYTQLDLRTGKQKVVAITTQIDDTELNNKPNVCNMCAANFAKKMSNWVDDSNSNVIVNLTKISFKDRDNDWGLWHTWDDYKLCNTISIVPLQFTDLVVTSLRDQNKVGYNVNKDRILEDL